MLRRCKPETPCWGVWLHFPRAWQDAVACGDVCVEILAETAVRRRAGGRSRPRLKSPPPPHARRRATRAPTPAGRHDTQTPTHVTPPRRAPTLCGVDHPHARRDANTTRRPHDHNTQRLLPDQKRLLERPVQPDHVCQTSERRGEPRAVPPHRNHVRPVAPLIIQRMVVAAPQRQ